MKKLALALVAFLFAVGGLVAQDAKNLYQTRFSYDLKQDKESVILDGKTFWLRMSSLKDDNLTLTYLLKGQTPTTATEILTCVLAAPGETVFGYSSKLIERTKPLTPIPADITLFDQFQGGDQRIVSFLLEDRANNLVQDSIFRITQWTGKRVTVIAHSIRIKYSDAAANPDSAAGKIGERRDDRMLAMTYVNSPF